MIVVPTRGRERPLAANWRPMAVPALCSRARGSPPHAHQGNAGREDRGTGRFFPEISIEPKTARYNSRSGVRTMVALYDDLPHMTKERRLGSGRGAR